MLSDTERRSLELAETEHTYKVRLVYFAMKRCSECTERRSCIKHEDEMLHIDALDTQDLLRRFEDDLEKYESQN